jgi:hypothetical protein
MHVIFRGTLFPFAQLIDPELNPFPSLNFASLFALHCITLLHTASLSLIFFAN